MRGDDIEERLVAFAVRIVKLSAALRKTAPGKVMAAQLVRSGTSAGANYEEARGAESPADFRHKLGVALKELRETRYWLKVIQGAELFPATKTAPILDEADQLCRILGKSVVTSKSKVAVLPVGESANLGPRPRQHESGSR